MTRNLAAVMAVALCAASGSARGDSLPPVVEMKKLSLEELMDIDVQVSVVSKRPEKLREAASAVQVITQEDIRRSGAMTLPEALRLASNLQVAQIDARQWAVSARGFNNTVSNKLLVMIDGRTVYTPLYAGVFWDAQQVLLEDVDHIEVVSGPGGTLWGANAVNGVINIVTKDARNSQGVFLAADTGTFLRDALAARYGGNLGSGFSYRVYGQRTDHGGTEFPDGSKGRNAWGTAQGGFRSDWQPDAANGLTLQGDAYTGDAQQPLPGEIETDGQNLLGRWTRDLSPESDVQAQAYFDRTSRTIPGTFAEDLNTYDLDLQYRVPFGARQSTLWGLGYRAMHDEVTNSRALAFLPADTILQLYSGFFQDQIALIPEKLKLTLGTKFEHNDYSGFEIMPSGHLAWTPDDRQTLWGAVSRAVRSPSRIDVDFFASFPPNPAGLTTLAGGPDFTSEKLVAYEWGYRFQPDARLQASLSLFYNRYDDLRSLERSAADSTEAVIANGMHGDSRGLELSGSVQPLPWWRLRGGYTYLETDIKLKPGHASLNGTRGEGDDPAHQFSVQSMMDLPEHFQLNGTGRYASSLPFPFVSDYSTFDLGLVWSYRAFEVAVMGRDLATTRHAEFASGPALQEVPRSVSARVACRL